MPTAPASLSPAALARLAGDLRLACMRISRRVRYEGDATLPPHHFSVLARLENQPRTPRELAEIERVSAPSIARTAAALVDSGLVSRTDDPTDRRSVILSLTPHGLATLKTVRRHRDEWIHRRLRQLSAAEQQVLVEATEILERIATAGDSDDGRSR